MTKPLNIEILCPAIRARMLRLIQMRRVYPNQKLPPHLAEELDNITTIYIDHQKTKGVPSND